MTIAMILVFFGNMAFALAVGIALMIRMDNLEERIEDIETLTGHDIGPE